ncbi:two-component sensor histidine kinase [Streptomyces tuirus]|uniref:histidine kinase n=1 Tax=Streptomyces tuirus TaxID=68278 RepID=A0A941FC91_9ACTN|nr:two-component sensor histidine kinase [Streptomyces tuirus]
MIASLVARLASWKVADDARPQVRRWAVPAFCAVLGIPNLWGSSDRAEAVTTLALILAFTIPLLWRDRRPMLVFLLITAVSVIALPVQPVSGAGWSRAVALHNVGRHSTPRRLAVAITITVVQLLVWGMTLESSSEWQHAVRPGVITLLAVVTVTAVAVLGLAGRVVTSYIATLEKERDQQADLAAARERARVSREMHDILGHTLAVIVRLADGAAALAATKPQRGAETLQIIADSGRDALGELRRLLAVVGDETDVRPDSPLAPQPGLSDLDALLDRVRAAGPTATLHTVGDLACLTQGLQLTVYRIIQEALTNTLKHAASDTTVHVTVTADTESVRVSIEDIGPARSPKAGLKPRSTHGLIGMRQRASLYQGEVAAGPNERGGWTVRAGLVPTTHTAHPEKHPV